MINLRSAHLLIERVAAQVEWCGEDGGGVDKKAGDRLQRVHLKSELAVHCQIAVNQLSSA